MNNMEKENIFEIIHTQYHKLKSEKDELHRIVNENKIEIEKLRKANKQQKQENEEDQRTKEISRKNYNYFKQLHQEYQDLSNDYAPKDDEHQDINGDYIGSVETLTKYIEQLQEKVSQLEGYCTGS